ncbi:MAG: MFS transporter [Anaerolineae bacterium]|nr:MFS transporter [Anaerolineae bacterium]
MNRHFTGLWRHPDFMKLWIGQTISAVGSRITREGLPLTALLILSATPAQLGILTALGSLPVLFLSLIAGVWVDRLRRRPILIVADAGRFVLLLTIPAAALTGHLTMGLLYVVAVLAAALTLFFDVAYESVLPALVQPENVLEGNSKLATTESLAEIGGPALAGALIQLITAPLAICLDALSFLISAVSVVLIRAPEPAPKPRVEEQTIWHEIIEGLRVIAHNPVLRTLAIGMGVRGFFGNFFGTLYGLYAIRELGLSPAVLGVLIGMGGVGALVGALLAARLPRRFGLGRTLTAMLLISGLINGLIPLASGPTLLSAGMLMLAQLIGDAAMVVFLINELSLRQVIVPDRLLGRVNASVGFLARGIAPVGALVAGLLADQIGARPTLWIAVIGILLTSLWMLASPVRQLQQHLAYVPAEV